MVTESLAAPRGVVELPTPGAFSHVRGGMCPAGAAGTSTVNTGAPVAGAVAANAAVANAVVANAVVANAAVANAAVAAGVPAANVREQVNTVPFTAPRTLGRATLGRATLGQTTSVHVTVRRRNTYMTRFIANGGDAPGPHRWRVPV